MRGLLQRRARRFPTVTRLAAGLAFGAVLLLLPTAAYARVTQIVVDDTQPLNGGYHQISGRAFGELDPSDPRNAIIQDINLGQDADGKVRYIASFVLTVPDDLSKSSGRQVHDGMWPIIAGHRIALNFRWAQPDGVLELYQAGSEGPQWWATTLDDVRGLPANGILVRCQASGTCPRVIEHFGSAEVWALKLTPEWVGTNADTDIPLPANVRRYYLPSTTHGGTVVAAPSSVFNASLPRSLLRPASCPGNNYGTGVLSANPVPHTETVNALLVHFRDWVMHDIEPPASRYPTLRDGNLVEPIKEAMGFPTIPPSVAGPGWRTTLPEPGFINPVLDYDWGPNFDPSDATGVPTLFPPPLKRVIKMLVPRVDADGNEVGGFPLVLNDAPLGTYLGWKMTDNRTSPPLAQYRPFHGGQLCDYVGGMIPFAKTKAERDASGDPRLSLEERYKDHAGYVDAVRQAAASAVAQGFVLQADADTLIGQADASNVLK